MNVHTADLEHTTLDLEIKVEPEENGKYCQYAEMKENKPHQDNYFNAVFKNIAMNMTFDFQMEADSVN